MNRVMVVKNAGRRLDRFVADNIPEFSRTYLQKLIEDGHITVNRQPVKPGLRLATGDKVEITIPAPETSTLSPEAIPLQIVYEDNDILVINKPPGMTTHPSPGQTKHTLVNAILSHYPHLADLGDTLRPGIVHRLDKDTSGLIIIAKNTKAQLNLISQFKERTVQKTYLALVQGHLTPEEGVIEANIGRHPGDRKRMAVVASGNPARSAYKVLRYIRNYTYLEVKPETGRTHQIRVHLSAIGFPIIGDSTYGVKSPFLKRQFLHAHKISFRLPATGETIEFHSELPEDLKHALSAVGDSR